MSLTPLRPFFLKRILFWSILPSTKGSPSSMPLGITDSAAPESVVIFPLPAEFNRPAFPTPAIAFSGMRTSSPPTSQVSETSNLLLTFRPRWCREHVPLAATSLRHCLPWAQIEVNAAHAVVVSVITLMVVVLFDNIGGFPRKLFRMERPASRSVMATLPTVSAHLSFSLVVTLTTSTLTLSFLVTLRLLRMETSVLSESGTRL